MITNKLKIIDMTFSLMTEKTKMTILDKYLFIWIGLAMAIGILLGRFVPQVADWLDTFRIDTLESFCSNNYFQLGNSSIYYAWINKIIFKKLP
jgi:hypothetical protein